jgi:AcrR family transcriptional regulator
MKLVGRREEYRESLREDILDAARQLFVRDGYEATSMRAIAAKVGCSPGILYHYFEDKQAIMARLVRETFCLMRQRLSAIRDDASPPEERLRRALRAYIDFGLEHPHHYGVLFMNKHDLENMPDLLHVFMQDGMETFSCLRSLCAECMAKRIFRPELRDDDEVAQALWVSIHGLLSLQIQSRTFPWVERNRLMDTLVRGVAR